MSCLWYAARRNGLILYHYNYECSIDLPPNRAENPKHKLAQSLSAIPAFMAVAKEPRQLEDLVKGTRIQHFGVGEPIITQGDRVRALYIIIVGCVDLVVNDEYGELSVLNLGKGEFFGVESMFSREPSSASFVATEDMEVLVIGADAVLSMIRRQPNLSTEITKVIEVRKNAINVAKRTNANEKRKYLGKEDEDQEQVSETTLVVTPLETERDLTPPSKELAEKKDLVGKKEALPEKTKINK
jgi:CRP-like cAMP-binding protein